MTTQPLEVRPTGADTSSRPPFAGRPGLLLPLVAALEAMLVVLWLTAQPWAGRTTDAPQWLGTFASLCGLTGLLLYAVTIALSARLRWIETLIGGLDKVYRQHHVLGSASFALLLLHPVLYAWKYAHISLERSAHLFGPSTRWPLLAGQVALYLMIPALVATLYMTVRHQTLVAMQKLLGVLFLPATYHSLFTGGDAKRYLPLRLYLAAVCATAVASLVKHTLLGHQLDRHRRFTVDSITPLGTDYAELWLQPTAGALRFVPGQFAYLRFPDAPIPGEGHPFSIACAPDQDRIRFVIKQLGDWTRRLGEIQPGTAAVVEGPYGRFSHRFVRGHSQLWVAGGIGITPFLSMAAALPPDSPYDVDLVWCYPTHASAVFLDELTRLAAQRPNLRIHPRCDLDHPLPTATSLAALCAASPGSDLEHREVLLCGPAPMRDSLRTQLHAIGISEQRIRDEEFRYS